MIEGSQDDVEKAERRRESRRGIRGHRARRHKPTISSARHDSSLHSPGSCDVNVNRPSDGPLVFTTVCPLDNSCPTSAHPQRVLYRITVYQRGGADLDVDVDPHRIVHSPGFRSVVP